MGDARAVARRVRAAAVLGVVVALVAVPAGAAGADAALTKERLYELTRARPYGTPVALDLPGERPYGGRITDSGFVIGSTEIDGVYRGFRWRDGRTELLPDVFGEGWSSAGANESGQVVVMPEQDSEGFLRPYLWQPDGSVVDISAGERWRQVAGINDDGVVVGTVEGWVPVTWRDGVLTRHPAPGGRGVQLAQGRALNDRGEFIGWVSGEDLRTHGYVWRDGVPHELPAAWDANVSVQRINDRGDVLGHVSSRYGTGLAVWHGGKQLRWVDKDDRYGMQVSDMNERGVVVGQARPYHLRGPLRSDQRGVIMPLPGLGGMQGGEVWAVHDLDVAVGSGYRAGDEWSHPVAWVLTAPVPLGERLGGEQARSGWAVDVNAQGQVLGRLFFPDGRAEVVVWDLRRG